MIVSFLYFNLEFLRLVKLFLFFFCLKGHFYPFLIQIYLLFFIFWHSIYFKNVFTFHQYDIMPARIKTYVLSLT
ncbi:unnamed protein product [Meloidogyne enterolobii]|uniref:Uncharacterized protein n=1 Tax=Meloidogyne enterolobii TaxID=390850 RepID=A0ACB0XZ04_MELEN